MVKTFLASSVPAKFELYLDKLFSCNVIKDNFDINFTDANSPTKDDETSLLEEASLLLTPSRHHDDQVKRVSLFNETEDIDENTTAPKSATVLDLSEDKETNFNTPELETVIEEVESLTVQAGKGEICDNNKKEEDPLPVVEDDPPVSHEEQETSTVCKQDFSTQTPEKSVPPPAEKTFLETLKDQKLDVDGFTNKELFEMINKLENMKTSAMQELQKRMASD